MRHLQLSKSTFGVHVKDNVVTLLVTTGPAEPPKRHWNYKGGLAECGLSRGHTCNNRMAEVVCPCTQAVKDLQTQLRSFHTPLLLSATIQHDYCVALFG